MPYKKYIPNRRVRLKILRMLEFVPDKVMLQIQYRIKLGRNLNLSNPTRFSEKIQWYKLHYRDPLMIMCVDKYRVREYVKQKGLEDILIPLYDVYDSVEEINFEKLPQQFVLKTTNNSQTVIICSDKNNFDFEEAKKKLNYWLHIKKPSSGREWAYNGVKPRIVCEKFLEQTDRKPLIDYKFFSFGGKVPYLTLITGKYPDAEREGILDYNFEKIAVEYDDVVPLEKDELKKPKNFNRMLEISRILSQDFPQVRVDLYNVDGKIYFGELTFYESSGYLGFVPDEFDYHLGSYFKLPSNS